MQTVKETDMLAAKIDLLMKRLDDRAQEKEAMTSIVNTIDSRMTCEVCGNIGHLGNDCPETEEDIALINNGFCQPGNNGWNN